MEKIFDSVPNLIPRHATDEEEGCHDSGPNLDKKEAQFFPWEKVFREGLANIALGS
jgi:hypothetical protein